MEITFVIPFIALTGGVKAVMEWANQLQAMGHEVTLIYPKASPYPWQASREGLEIKAWLGRLRGETRYWMLRLVGKNEVRWFPLRANLNRVPDLSEKRIPEGDIVVAVDWTTAERVSCYSIAKGIKFYLIQGYEVWSGPKERVEATWRMPLRKIVVSSWLKDLAEIQFGQQVLGPLIYGVDFDQFHPQDRQFNNIKFNNIKRIGMLYHGLELKGVADGLRALGIARRKHPDIQLVMYGAEEPRPALPDYVEFHLRPLGARLRKLYCSCDIWLCPSWMEGAGMPSMEAMACKCALVTTDVGAVQDYAVPEETALVSPPRDPEALARNLIRLLGDEEELQRISLAGYEKIREFTWERSAKQLEGFFLEALEGQ